MSKLIAVLIAAAFATGAAFAADVKKDDGKKAADKPAAAAPAKDAKKEEAKK